MKHDLIEGNMTALMVILGLAEVSIFFILFFGSLEWGFKPVWWTIPAMIIVGVALTNGIIFLDHYTIGP